MTPRTLAKICYSVVLVCAMTMFPLENTGIMILKCAEILCLGVLGAFVWD